MTLPNPTSNPLPPMSPTTREILSKIRRMIPPMLDKFHKGQLGRVAVIGGSEDYTGAPYFSAMASARLGCDMSHVICTPAAAAVIKTYSPNLMVHPLLRQSASDTHPDSSASSSHHRSQDSSEAEDSEARDIADRVTALFPRLHVLVVGPGLGRDPLLQRTCARVVRAARREGIPVVLDADALMFVGRHPSVVALDGGETGQGGSEGAKGGACVLTPNVVEFGRLSRAVGVDVEEEDGDGVEAEGERDEEDGLAGTGPARALARALGGVTVVQKGERDVITDGGGADAAVGDRGGGDEDSGAGTGDEAGYGTFVVDLRGGKKRSGGQGDTLTGCIATFLAWRKAYMDGLWDVTRGGKVERLGARELVGLAAFGGSAVTRECSRLAFAKHGRSLQASDLTEQVHTAFLNLFGDVDDDSGDGQGSEGGAKL